MGRENRPVRSTVVVILVPLEDYAASVPLPERQYIAKIQIAIPSGITDESPETTHLHQILGFDRGAEKARRSQQRGRNPARPRTRRSRAKI